MSTKVDSGESASDNKSERRSQVEGTATASASSRATTSASSTKPSASTADFSVGQKHWTNPAPAQRDGAAVRSTRGKGGKATPGTSLEEDDVLAPVAGSADTGRTTAGQKKASNEKEPIDSLKKAKAQKVHAHFSNNRSNAESGAPASSFASLVQGWENYLGDGARTVSAETFQPLQMLQKLSLCGASHTLEAPRDEAPGAQRGQHQIRSRSHDPERSHATKAGESDPLQPIMLRYTQSSPLKYSRMFDDDNLAQSDEVEPMRRSSSTPSTSAFRHSRVGSAFGTQLRGLPPLSGPDDRSAFSLPLQRRSYAASSDSGIHYSAFKPVASTPSATAEPVVPTDSESDLDSESPSQSNEQVSVRPQDATRSTVQDTAVSSTRSGATPTESTTPAPSRAAKFFSDVKAIRRRHRRSGRENPARPPSSSSSSKGDDEASIKLGEDESVENCSKVLSKQSVLLSSTSGAKASPSPPTETMQPSAASVRKRKQMKLDEADAHGAKPPPHTPNDTVPTSQSHGNDHIDGSEAVSQKEPVVRRYHRLDSDEIEDEADALEGIEAVHHPSPTQVAPPASIHHHVPASHTESPTPIPSPVYEQFMDEQDENRMLPLGRITTGNTTSRVPPTSNNASILKTPPHSTSSRRLPRNVVSLQPGLMEGNSLSPSSHGSGTHSRATTRSTMTSNTSGHTTQATSTSATISSGHSTVTSSVADADREVMETNRAERLRRGKLKQIGGARPNAPSDLDGSASVHSSSTASTNTNAYLALASSPAPLRDGANLPVERFFGETSMSTSIPITYSTSSNTTSTISGGTHGATGVASCGSGQTGMAEGALSSNKRVGGATASPTTVSSASAANTSSSSSNSEEPPRFVSYLDRQPAGIPTPARTPPRVATRISSGHRSEIGDICEDRDSPAEIVGYSRLIFEEAASTSEPPSQHPKPIRPVRKREKLKKRFMKLKTKPPRSPVKMGGASTPTSTPPPTITHSLGGTTLSSESSSASSSAHHQISPPRHIIDPHGPNSAEHPIRPGLSRPHVLRSTSGGGPGNAPGSMILIPPTSSAAERGFSSPDAVVMSSPLLGNMTHIVGGGADEGAQEVFTAPPLSSAENVSHDRKNSSGHLLTLEEDFETGEGQGDKSKALATVETKKSNVVTPEKNNATEAKEEIISA